VKLGTISGSTPSVDCARFDTNGNVVDGGAASEGGPNFQQAFTSVTSVTRTHNLNSTGLVFACFDNSAPPRWILLKSVCTDQPEFADCYICFTIRRFVRRECQRGWHTAGVVHGISIVKFWERLVTPRAPSKRLP
jgi:hypothetical protein